MTESLRYISIAKADELKSGERLLVELNDEWVILFNVDGSFYAVEDMCSHEEAYLSEGELDGYCIECTKHGAQFDIRTGAQVAPPAVLPVKTYPVRVEGDEVQVGVV